MPVRTVAFVGSMDRWQEGGGTKTTMTMKSKRWSPRPCSVWPEKIPNRKRWIHYQNDVSCIFKRFPRARSLRALHLLRDTNVRGNLGGNLHDDKRNHDVLRRPSVVIKRTDVGGRVGEGERVYRDRGRGALYVWRRMRRFFKNKKKNYHLSPVP